MGEIIMETFDLYKKEGNGIKPIFVEDLIPFGRENAISREALLMDCDRVGLCSDDRAMRRLIQRARIDTVILNNQNGNGYYRPTHDDLLDLQRYINQEENRAKVIFKDIKKAKALYEDLKKGRINEQS